MKLVTSVYLDHDYDDYANLVFHNSADVANTPTDNFFFNIQN